MNNRLIELRKTLDLTQTEFAKTINLSKSQISSIENGVRNLTDRTISDICREFNVNEYWLRDGEGPVFRPPVGIDEELAMEIGELINSDDDFMKSSILMMLRLTPEERTWVKEKLKNIILD